MPYYRFRCEAQDRSGHFRSGTIQADSQEAAENYLDLRELEWAVFQLPAERVAELCVDHGVDSLDELPKPAPVNASDEDKAAFRALPVRDRAHLNLHRQTKPYKRVELVEIPAPGSGG